MAEASLLGMGILPGTPLSFEVRSIIKQRLDKVEASLGRAQAEVQAAISLTNRATVADLPVLEGTLGRAASDLGSALRNTIVARGTVRDLLRGL